MSYGKYNVICNKKNYKNNLNKIVKNSATNSKKHQISNKIHKKISEPLIGTITDKSYKYHHNHYRPKNVNTKNNKNKYCNNISTTYGGFNSGGGVGEGHLPGNGNKEITIEQDMNSEKNQKRHNFSSYTELRKRKSKSKITRNVHRTNNLIEYIEKLIKQNVEVERGARKLRASNHFNLFFPKIKKKILKEYDLNIIKNSNNNGNTYKNNRENLITKIESNYKSSNIPTTSKTVEHDSVQEIMFSNTFKERSDSSRLEHERSNWLHNYIAKETKRKKSGEYAASLGQQKSAGTTEKFYDCTSDNQNNSNSNYNNVLDYKDPDNYEDNNNNNSNDNIETTSSKILIHFKDMLNQYLKKSSIGDTKFFLSKEDIEFLRGIVEADEKYHQLHLEDHFLLKEILLSQLEEIQMHQNIVDDILKTLKINTTVEEDMRYLNASSRIGSTISKLEDRETSKCSKESCMKNCKDSISSESFGNHTSAIDAHEPHSYIRSNNSFNNSCDSTSQEQLSQLLDKEDGKKMQHLLQELLTKANNKSSSFKKVLSKDNLETITERTEPAIALNSINQTNYKNDKNDKKSKNYKNTKNDKNDRNDKKNKKLGVELKEIRYENYVIVESLPACSIVNPINTITEAYTALEFIKQKMSLESLKNAKEVYIPKAGSTFEMERVNYEDIMSNPEKLKRVLKIQNLENYDSDNCILKKNNESSCEDEINHIGLRVALFENYNCILESIEEVNKYIKTSIQKIEERYQTNSSNGSTPPLPLTPPSPASPASQPSPPSPTSPPSPPSPPSPTSTVLSALPNQIKTTNKYDDNKIRKELTTTDDEEEVEYIPKRIIHYTDDTSINSEISLKKIKLKKPIKRLNSFDIRQTIKKIDSINLKECGSSKTIVSDFKPSVILNTKILRKSINTVNQAKRETELITMQKPTSTEFSDKIQIHDNKCSGDNGLVSRKKNIESGKNMSKSISTISKLEQSPSMVMQLIYKTRMTLVKNSMVIAFQSGLFSLIVLALSLPDPICLRND